MDAALVDEADAPAKARAIGREQETPSRKGRSTRRRIARSAAAAALVALGVFLLFWRGNDRPAALSPPAAPPLSTVLQPRDDLAPLIYVKSLDGGRAKADYRAEVRDSDGERRDTLTLGDPSSKGAFLIASARLSGGASAQTMFFVEMARLSAEVGLSVAHASTAAADASLGDGLIASDVTLQGSEGDRSCVGFRFNADAKIDLAGLACGETSRSSDHDALECLISRLRATPDGAALGLSNVLKDGARNPSSC
jgi:hypothetical protein